MNNHTLKHSQTGATLVEVVVGLAIMGTLLVGILMARQNHTKQFDHAQSKIVAVQAADELLTKWWRDPEQFPRHASGVCPGVDHLFWRTNIRQNHNASQLGIEVVRLEILETTFQIDGTQSEDRIITFVDIALAPHTSEKSEEFLQ